jgi:hypothetical protein
MCRHIQEEKATESNDDDPDSESQAADTQTEDERKVQSLGRGFMLTKRIWLKDETLDTKIDDNYDEKKHFDGDESQGSPCCLIASGERWCARDGSSMW